jgi:hypothetical protein
LNCPKNKFKEKNMIGLERDATETPRTDGHLRAKEENGHLVIVSADFARQLEQENENLRKLLDKASQALSCFIDLRGMTASELKSAHNGICVLLNATKMLDAINAGVKNEVQK